MCWFLNGILFHNEMLSNRHLIGLCNIVNEPIVIDMYNLRYVINNLVYIKKIPKMDLL